MKVQPTLDETLLSADVMAKATETNNVSQHKTPPKKSAVVFTISLLGLSHSQNDILSIRAWSKLFTSIIVILLGQANSSQSKYKDRYATTFVISARCGVLGGIQTAFVGGKIQIESSRAKLIQP